MEKVICGDRDQSSHCLCMCVGEGSAGPVHEQNFWNYRNVLYLDWVVLTQMDMFVKNY